MVCLSPDLDENAINTKAIDGKKPKSLALLVVSITRTYRLISITTTPVTSIARCYRPTTVAVCSKKKREIKVIPGPPGAEA